jgi:predicted enzyme related to lactoylglutathione lyase
MTLHDTTFAEIISVLKETAMPNPFCHVELNTTDVTKAKEFYSKLFGWELEEMPGGEYTMIRVGEGTGGGIMKNPVPGAPSFWLSYILVDDVLAATRKARSLGATVMRDVTAIPGYGEFSVLQDPTGAHFALWKAKA